MKNLLSIISENLTQAYINSSIWYSGLTLLEELALWIGIASGIATLLGFFLVPPPQVQALYEGYSGLTSVHPVWLGIGLTATTITLLIYLKKRGRQERERQIAATIPSPPLPIDLPTLEAQLLLRIPDILPIDHWVMTHLEHLKMEPTLLETDVKLKILQSLVQQDLSAPAFVKSYLIDEFSSHSPKLEPSIRRQVIQHLGQLQKPAADTKLPLLVDFIIDADAQKFSAAWRQWQPDTPKPQTTPTTPDVDALGERVTQGEIALFLGSDLPNAMVQPLATFCKYEKFKGILPKICEYVQLHPNYQRTQLCHQVQQELHTQRQSISTAVPKQDLVTLYELLAKVSQPLILISTCYDSLLEDTFTAHHKKFALLFYANDSHKLFIQYSDQPTPQSLGKDEEELYKQAPLQNGYTLIYKIRGHFTTQDCLTLSEQDYFNLAKEVDKCIPNQLGTLLQTKNLWCLGHSPQTWADRFLLNAIFQKRGKQPGKTAVVQKDPDEFARVYWEDKGARIYDKIDLSEFVEKLNIAMTRNLTTTT